MNKDRLNKLSVILNAILTALCTIVSTFTVSSCIGF